MVEMKNVNNTLFGETGGKIQFHFGDGRLILKWILNTGYELDSCGSG
jgi:hypothetical protein